MAYPFQDKLFYLVLVVITILSDFRRFFHPLTVCFSSHLVVGHALCQLTAGGHTSQTGRVLLGTAHISTSNRTRTQALVTAYRADYPPRFPLEFVIQHELAHNLSADHCDLTVTGVACVMGVSDLRLMLMDEWCNPCAANVLAHRQRLMGD